MFAASLMVLSAALGGGDAHASKIPAGRYAGTTYPGASFQVRITKKRRARFFIQPTAKCSDGTTHTFSFSPAHPPKLKRGGKFSYLAKGASVPGYGGTARLRLSGKMDRSFGSGHFSLRVRNGSVGCKVRGGRWDAYRLN